MPKSATLKFLKIQKEKQVATGHWTPPYMFSGIPCDIFKKSHFRNEHLEVSLAFERHRNIS